MIQDLRLAVRGKKVWRPDHEKRAGSPGRVVTEFTERLEMLVDGKWVEVPRVHILSEEPEDHPDGQ